MRVNMTRRTVERTKPGSRDIYLWDTKIPGFGVKVTPHGRRIYLLQYSRRNRTRRVRIGEHSDELTTERARVKAGALRAAVDGGADPAAERRIEHDAPTLSEFARRYLEEHAAVKKKPRSAEEDERNMRRHVLPALGHLRVNEITRADVARFHARMRATPGAANRCLALLSKMMNLAERWGERPDGSNPARHVDKYPEHRVERYLSGAELALLGKVLAEAEAGGEHPSIVAAIRLLIFTGCRRNEVLTLQWSHVDIERGCLHLPDSKTGAKVVPLGAPALELLSGLPRRQGNPYVLPDASDRRKRRTRTASDGSAAPLRPRPAKHFVGIERAWSRLRDRVAVRQWAASEDGRVAGLMTRLQKRLGREPRAPEAVKAAAAAGIELPDSLRSARLHDLRHSFASAGAGMGESLYLIGNLLGHRSAAMTKRYAHLSDDPLRASADRISSHIAAQLQGRAADVVPIGKSKS